MIIFHCLLMEIFCSHLPHNQFSLYRAYQQFSQFSSLMDENMGLVRFGILILLSVQLEAPEMLIMQAVLQIREHQLMYNYFCKAILFFTCLFNERAKLTQVLILAFYSASNNAISIKLIHLTLTLKITHFKSIFATKIFVNEI